jgi:lipid-A-disaccharide synthase-like uncharacterized protein
VDYIIQYTKSSKSNLHQTGYNCFVTSLLLLTILLVYHLIKIQQPLNVLEFNQKIALGNINSNLWLEMKSSVPSIHHYKTK